MTIGNKIKEMRKSASLTQQGLAEKSCKNKQTIVCLENEQYLTPSIDLILRISDACGYALELNFVPLGTECKELTISELE